MSAKHINSFCIDRDEELLFYGNKSGQIYSVNIDSFDSLHYCQAHYGNVHAMCAHPKDNIIAALGQDRSISLWEYDSNGQFKLISIIPTRDYTNDDVAFVPSESQAIAIHHTLYKVATRSGNGHLIEFDFNLSGNYRLINCLRPFNLLENGCHEDIITLKYVENSNQILAGGAYGSVALIENGKTIKQWRFGDASVHWFEHIKDNIYYIASDTRRVVRLNLDNEQDNLIGNITANDDMEHVTFNPVTGKLYASSFDRNIYDISLETCHKKAVLHVAPYLIRWIKTLKKLPPVLIIQCRNGSLYKLDLDTNEIIHSIQEMRNAVWTAAVESEKIYLAGEGNSFMTLTHRGISLLDRYPGYASAQHPLPDMGKVYIKRMAVYPSKGLFAFGYSNGKVIAGAKDNLTEVADLGLAVRDLAFSSENPILYSVAESGVAIAVNMESGEKRELLKEHDPLWSLAINEALGVIATGQRNGNVHFIDIHKGEVLGKTASYRPKRMKWINDTTLLVTNSTAIDKIYKNGDEWMHEEHFFESFGNTVEDFIIDANQRYLIAITYNRDIWLCDLATGKKLDSLFNGIDYTKGLMYLDPSLKLSDYPGDFIAFGRNGIAFMYRIANEQILPIGELARFE